MVRSLADRTFQPRNSLVDLRALVEADAARRCALAELWHERTALDIGELRCTQEESADAEPEASS